MDDFHHALVGNTVYFQLARITTPTTEMNILIANWWMLRVQDVSIVQWNIHYLPLSLLSHKKLVIIQSDIDRGSKYQTNQEINLLC